MSESVHFPSTWRVRLEFKKVDCWVGVYWTRGNWHTYGGTAGRKLEIYICLLPMIPIHLTRTTAWTTCYECGKPITGLKGTDWEVHGRAGSVHIKCSEDAW